MDLSKAFDYNDQELLIAQPDIYGFGKIWRVTISHILKTESSLLA